MSKFVILISILIALLLLSLGYIIYKQSKIPAMKENAVLENILSRKSVRNFVKGKEINREQLEKILRAGMAAPSARNSQPWEFIVIKDKDILKSLADKNPHGKMLEDASCAIVVAGNIDKTGGADDFWSQDTSAATENMLLEIEALKLGAVWIGVYPKKERMKIVIEELELPENVIPLNIVAIGYPTGKDKPKDKWNPDNIHYDKY